MIIWASGFIVFGLAVLVSGSRKRDAVARLHGIDRMLLRRECEALWSHEADIRELPPEKWPTTVRAMHPVSVGKFSNGVAIRFHRWVSKEDGILVCPSGSIPQGNPISGYERIEEGIYWYWVSG